MEPRLCVQCKKPLTSKRRGVFCGKRCVWRAWQQRAIARGSEARQLPQATLPLGAEAILPAGPDRLLVANQLALVHRAPPGACGYRVGIQQGLRLMRWFPPARSRTPPMFRLEPFERPEVPLRGLYAVVYLDERCLPIGGPRFTVALEHVTRGLILTDGDRTYKPRLRW
ncbi:MAG: hypothetical protein U1A78_40230 [Polyangia bacterium]